MKELITHIVKSLVDDPERVVVTETLHGAEYHILVQVAKEDMGRVIGKGGRVANAMRLLLNVAAAQEGRRALLDIEEPE